MEPQRDVYGPLNGLRGMAAICVVIFHAQEIMGRQLAPRGYLAVDLFFVLSGFVIAHAYERRFAEGLDALHFFWLRTKRFYPLYLAGLMLGSAVMAIDMLNPPGPMSWLEYAIAVTIGVLFLPLPWRDLYPLNVPSWSLLCELLVNLIYGLLWRRPIILAGVSAAAWGCLFFRTIGEANLVTGMLRALFSFPVGVFLYRWQPKMPDVPPWLVISLLAAAMLTPFPDMLAITFVFPFGIALLARCGDNPAFEVLGRLSFPLYAIHWPIIQFGLGLSHRVPLNPLLQGCVWVLISIAAAWGADAVIERHFSRQRLPRSMSPLRSARR
jgi:peptidoglycan/LPS O-acetylase OafA/YrhL